MGPFDPAAVGVLVVVVTREQELVVAFSMNFRIEGY